MVPFERPTIAMCPPDFYGIEYEINPWMSRGRQSDPVQSCAQWDALHSLLISLGADVRLMEPVKGLPDLVFTANAGLVWQGRVFLSRFRYKARQGETPVNQRWFDTLGFETIELPDVWNFEGAGDALFCGDTLYGGYLIRSDAVAMQWIASQIGFRVIPLQLVNEYFYHLDTCFCPLSDHEAIYYPEAFDEYAQRSLQQHIPNLIPVRAEEAARFACNAIVIDKHVVLNTECPRLEQDLEERGYTPHATPLDEFIKSGGSAKCLTLTVSEGSTVSIT